jgi:hypothetical protein
MEISIYIYIYIRMVHHYPTIQIKLVISSSLVRKSCKAEIGYLLKIMLGLEST